MYAMLLGIIYLAFISLGLPDSLLGSAWPVMQVEMNAPMSYAGIVTMIIAGGTIISSLSSDRLTKKWGAGLVTAVSVLMTAVALLGFSISNEFWMLCLWAIPYGLGAGAVDAAINNFVAIHYNSRQMSWLHCFWGVGAAISPYIMSYALTGGLGWNRGFRLVSILQFILTAVLFVSIPLWNKQRKMIQNKEKAAKVLKLTEALKIRGVKYILWAFFGYCGLETVTGLWASTYLVSGRGINVELAASYASLFYLGITVGRFLCGFIADKMGDRNMIRLGIAVLLIGIIAILIPLEVEWLCLSGLVIVGLGGAPIYPSIIHSTPVNFGEENSQTIVGIQMASAYTGSTFMPPLFGLIADHVNVNYYPVFLLVLAVLVLVMTERLNKVIS